MNWQRGLFRLWLVASVIWVALMSLAAYQKVIIPRLNGASSHPIGTDVAHFFGVALGPVVAVLALGMISGWIISGFRRDPR